MSRKREVELNSSYSYYILPSMNPFERYIQKFPNPNAPFEQYTWQPHTHKLLVGFAQSIPPSSCSIIDLAAGRGRDASLLIKSGYPVIAQDINPSMIRKSLVPRHCLRGDATCLPYVDDSFGGAMLIDSLLYFSPSQRHMMLKEVFRTLVPDGRLLIISELAENSYSYLYDKKNNWYVYHGQRSNESFDDYVERTGNLINKHTVIFSAQFRCNPGELSSDACSVGFTEIDRQIYPKHESIAQESRWRKGEYPYFSIIFKK